MFAPQQGKLTPMRTNLSLDDELIAQARALTGINDDSRLVVEALNALIARESARWLARRGGGEPQIGPAPRRRASLLKPSP
jgi:post-segregation antitoxin (ccd killing protein)